MPDDPAPPEDGPDSGEQPKERLRVRFFKAAIDNSVWVVSRVIFAGLLVWLTYVFEVDLKKLMTGNALSAIQSHELERFHSEIEKIHDIDVAVTGISIMAERLYKNSSEYKTSLTQSDINSMKLRIDEAMRLFESRAKRYSKSLEDSISEFFEVALRHHAGLAAAQSSGSDIVATHQFEPLYTQVKQLESFAEDVAVFAGEHLEHLKEEVLNE